MIWDPAFVVQKAQKGHRPQDIKYNYLQIPLQLTSNVFVVFWVSTDNSICGCLPIIGFPLEDFYKNFSTFFIKRTKYVEKHGLMDEA